MKILFLSRERKAFYADCFFSTKPYDRIWFEPMAKDYGYEIYFIELPFSEGNYVPGKGL